jgi:hypothetical protein
LGSLPYPTLASHTATATASRRQTTGSSHPWHGRQAGRQAEGCRRNLVASYRKAVENRSGCVDQIVLYRPTPLKSTAVRLLWHAKMLGDLGVSR